MLIYAAIGAFGLLFLFVMLFVGELFGGDHEVHVGDVGADHGDISHDGGPSIFSARIMASFLTAFGVGGVVARYYGLPHPAAAGCGVVSGVVMSALVYQFAKILYSQQASSEVQMVRLIGRMAEVDRRHPVGRRRAGHARLRRRAHDADRAVDRRGGDSRRGRWSS